MRKWWVHKEAEALKGASGAMDTAAAGVHNTMDNGVTTSDIGIMQIGSRVVIRSKEEQEMLLPPPVVVAVPSTSPSDSFAKLSMRSPVILTSGTRGAGRFAVAAVTMESLAYDTEAPAQQSLSTGTTSPPLLSVATPSLRTGLSSSPPSSLLSPDSAISLLLPMTTMTSSPIHQTQTLTVTPEYEGPSPASAESPDHASPCHCRQTLHTTRCTSLNNLCQQDVIKGLRYEEKIHAEVYEEHAGFADEDHICTAGLAISHGKPTQSADDEVMEAGDIVEMDVKHLRALLEVLYSTSPADIDRSSSVTTSDVCSIFVTASVLPDAKMDDKPHIQISKPAEPT
ncbi:hypothetical protein BDQ12DRAFT_728952 [Crucibulum laeve]|uniref:Uncharacterized protein n=1 Tax=Crucibulum laeve TaxID=68775 RepID=A0A5C3LG67_9AGAR|nr:hypothetical protein BDQ12DRAFT_728952 [Crucibulum laeve]